MITVYPVLRQYMREHKTTLRELAAITNMNTFTLCLKMWGIKRWKLTEAVSICCFFHTPDAERLFSKKAVSAFCSRTL